MSFHLQESALLITSGFILAILDLFTDLSMMLTELGGLMILAGFIILYLTR